MTSKRIAELRKAFEPLTTAHGVVTECLDEIERLTNEVNCLQEQSFHDEGVKITLVLEALEGEKFRTALTKITDVVDDALLLDERLDDAWTELRNAVVEARKTLGDVND